MKKVHIPGYVFIGLIIVAVCLVGLFRNMSEGIDMRLIAVLIVAAVFIVLFCLKNVRTVETKPLPEGRKPSKSKFVAAKEKDDLHQKRLLDLYSYQKEEYRKNARNGIVFGIVGVTFVYVMMGFGKISLPVFALLSLFCVYYAGRCVWQWFINSDNPDARNIAAKFNITTLQDQIEATEKAIFENEERKRLSGVPEDTIAFIEKKEYLEEKE